MIKFLCEDKKYLYYLIQYKFSPVSQFQEWTSINKRSCLIVVNNISTANTCNAFSFWNLNISMKIPHIFYTYENENHLSLTYSTRLE